MLNTDTTATSILSLFVSILTVWQAGAMPILASREVGSVDNGGLPDQFSRDALIVLFLIRMLLKSSFWDGRGVD